MSQTPFGWENNPHRHQQQIHQQCGGVQTEADADSLLQEMARGGHQRMTVLPSPPEPIEPYRPTLATRVLRNTCYVAVILTCLLLAYTMFEVNAFVNDAQRAINEWSASFTSNLLGD